ncbi:MAG: iron complex outermembrane receptor protein [Halioglobus sp.]|jgi:iron complex outermembrane receptor protein
MTNCIRVALTPIVLGLMALNAQPLLAQSSGLEEVIVTAEKRSTTLQDTPIAVTAFTGEELDRALISKPMDMQFNVPNMLMSKGNFTTASISIRGIGNQAVGAQSDSGTGVHFNGVYLNGGRIFETEFYDAERVEVLRGPQGTLYGRNTTAGVVNLITNKPTDEFGGDVQLELGDYNHVKVKGAVNLPITDNLSQRFAMFYHTRDGFVDNEFDGSDIDDRDMYSIRSATRWSNDRADVTLTVNYFEEDDKRMRGSNQRCLRDPEGILGCLPTGLAAERTNGAATVTSLILDVITGPTLGVTFPEDSFANSLISEDPRTQYLDFTPQYQVEDLMGSLEANFDFGDYTFTSLTGYHTSDLDARNDYDFAVASEIWPVEEITLDLGPDGVITTDRLYSSDRATTEPEQYSQEFRLSSDYDGDWNFLIGGFYLSYESDVHYQIYSSALTVTGETLGLDPSFYAFDNDTSDYELETWAAFGELYWQTSDSVSMTLGLRYTEEEKSSKNRVIYLAFLDIPTADDDAYATFAGDWSEPTGKFNITWDVSDDVMTYVTLSNSYKSGGFNPISSENVIVDPEQGGDPALAEFQPEFITSIEIGAKSRFFEDTLQANVTYFYYDYEDLQIAKITNQIALNENFNAAIQGFEGEFIWLPVDSLRLSANIAWLDTEMDGGESVDPANINLLGTTENIQTGPQANVYVGPGCPNGEATCDGLPTQLDGNALPNSPEFSVNLGAAYFFHLENGMELVAATNYYWQDEFYTRVFNAPNDKVDEWEVWNATVTLYSADQDWFAELWGKNLKDDDNVTGQYLSDQNVGLATNQFLLEPRTYGITLGYNF